MCVIIARHFDTHGWVAVKNRDRNYTPEISFNRYHDEDTGIERLLFEDDVTQYSEGINSQGVAILSASLMVQDDEKEVTKSAKEKSPDGERIRRALLKATAFDAARECARLGLTGNSVILDRKELYLLESCKNRAGRYRYDLRKIPTDQTVARTNHGIWLPWAGYQRGIDESQDLSRISSEARRVQAEIVVETARTPEDMIDGLCKIMVDNPQLNVMRTSTERKKMRTTAQEMVIPWENTLFVRPVASHMTFDFWKLNQANADTWVEILSNRALYKDIRPEQEPPFAEVNTTHKVE
jgi:hypothetical protein